MHNRPVYQNISFGNDGILAEKYLSKMLNQMLTNEVVELQILDKGSLVDKLLVRKIAILFYEEPKGSFKSDAYGVRKDVKQLLNRYPECEFRVDFYRDTTGIFKVLEENK